MRVGMTEREIAAALNIELLRQGSDSELPFPPIVSSGPNSANPHASPSDRKLQRGDLLVVDWGAAAGGYVSDLTRTFAVGEVEPEFIKIAEIVLAANQAGRAAGRPGVPCSNVDKAARAVIEKSGYGAVLHAPNRAWHRHGRARGTLHAASTICKCYIRAWPTRSNPAFTCPAAVACASKTTWWSRSAGVDVLSDMPRELRIVG